MDIALSLMHFERFISQTGRHITFITGNHDVELAFKGVQERIC